MDKQKFYNTYNEITKEELTNSKLPFLKELLEKNIEEAQNLSDSLKDILSSFLAKKNGSLNSPASQFSGDYKNTLNLLIEKFEQIKAEFSKSNELINELKQNYSQKELEFLPALESKIFTIVYDNFTDNISKITSYLMGYKEWLEDTRNLPDEIKAKIKKENSVINAAERNDRMKEKILLAQKIRAEKLRKQQNKK